MEFGKKVSFRADAAKCYILHAIDHYRHFALKARLFYQVLHPHLA
jgi:hypothetical protein